MGLDQPVLSIITAHMPSASPPQWTSAVCPPCTFSGRIQGISLWGSLAMCLTSLTFGTGLEPYLVHFFLLARGDAFSCQLSLPLLGMGFFSCTLLSLQGGVAFSHPFLIRKGTWVAPANTFPDGDVDVQLAGGACRGHHFGRLPGNGKGLRDAAMTELPKMPCEMSQDIFEKLCCRSSPCFYHDSQAPSDALLLLVLSHLLLEMRALPQHI
jgi:hypothetical protein